MAEKGVIVDDATTGESIACRDAVQSDENSNSRIIQIIDKAARPVTYQLATPLRSDVGSIDSFELDPLPTAISASLIDVSDAESCVIWAMVKLDTDAAVDCECVVTPIIVSEDATPVAVSLLPPLQLRPVYPFKMSKSNLEYIYLLRKDNDTFYTIAQAFPTFGAKKIGFHIMIGSSDSKTSIDFYAAATSAAYRNSAIDQDVLDGTWGTYFSETAATPPA